MCLIVVSVYFFKQKTAYDMRISDWSSDVCSSDLRRGEGRAMAARRGDIDRVSKMIAVEIIGLARRDQRMREGGDDVVPAHVRDAQGRCVVERAHRAADPAESFVATMFFARIGEQLHPEADAEDGRALPTHVLLHRLHTQSADGRVGEE